MQITPGDKCGNAIVEQVAQPHPLENDLPLPNHCPLKDGAVVTFMQITPGDNCGNANVEQVAQPHPLENDLPLPNHCPLQDGVVVHG